MGLSPARPIKSIATSPGLTPFVAAGVGSEQKGVEPNLEKVPGLFNATNKSETKVPG